MPDLALSFVGRRGASQTASLVNASPRIPPTPCLNSLDRLRLAVDDNHTGVRRHVEQSVVGLQPVPRLAGDGSVSVSATRPSSVDPEEIGGLIARSPRGSARRT